MEKNFSDLFSQNKPIIGMIHLSGAYRSEKISRALEEIKIFESEGLDGAIVENYHGSIEDMLRALDSLSERETSLALGVNFLGNPYQSLYLAKKFNAKFVQFDSVQRQHINVTRYESIRALHPEIYVFGGVRFKYQNPTGLSLKEDIEDGKSRCDAVVTTGAGTGIETPLHKLYEFKSFLPDFPLLVGAGVNINNVYSQLEIADGAIVGSSLKVAGTNSRVSPEKTRNLMSEVKRLRKSLD